MRHNLGLIQDLRLRSDSEIAALTTAAPINALLVAQRLGYEKPSHSRVAELEITCSVTGKSHGTVKIEEGKFFSAIWVEAQYYHMENVGQIHTILMDEKAKKNLREYMGEAICSKKKIHPLVALLLSIQKHLLWVKMIYKQD